MIVSEQALDPTRHVIGHWSMAMANDNRTKNKSQKKVKEIIVLIKARSFLDELNLEHLTS